MSFANATVRRDFGRRRASASSSSTGRWAPRSRASRSTRRDFRGERFHCDCHLQGNNDLLTLTQPQAIEDIHLRVCDGRRRHPRDQHLLLHPIAQADYGMQEVVYELNRDGARLARRAALKAETARRQAAASSRARSGRPTAPPRSRPTSTIPASARSLSTSCAIAYGEQVARARRRRRRHAPDRDDLRHAQRQGGDLRLRRGCSTSAAVALPIMISGTITDRSGRTLSGPDADRVLAFGAPCRAVLHRPQLRARRGGDARALEEIAARRRHARLRLSQRRPAERVRRVRRDAGGDGRLHRRVRARRARQHRRRLLRHDARAHPRDRRGGRAASAARRPEDRAADAALGPRAVHAHDRHPASSTSASAPTSPARRSSAS